jgi:hypothetical protein
MLTIIHPKTKVTIEVADNDLEPMAWEDAEKACESYGNGWRLPTTLELDSICKNLHSNNEGNFLNTDYWSCTHSELYMRKGAYNFDRSTPFGSNINNIHSVRPVREL